MKYYHGKNVSYTEFKGMVTKQEERGELIFNKKTYATL